MEGIIGCFLRHCGLNSACNVLAYFGISPRSKASDFTWSQLFRSDSSSDMGLNELTLELPPAVRFPLAAMDTTTTGPVRLPVKASTASTDDFVQHATALQTLQATLGYHFKHPKYLSQALTHQSSSYATVFGNYQRYVSRGWLAININNSLSRGYCKRMNCRQEQPNAGIVLSNGGVCVVLTAKDFHLILFASSLKHW